MLSDRTKNWVVIAVTVVWVISVFVPIFVPSFQSAPISGVFVGTVGAMLTYESTVAIRARREKKAQANDDDGDNP